HVTGVQTWALPILDVVVGALDVVVLRLLERVGFARRDVAPGLAEGRRSRALAGELRGPLRALLGQELLRAPEVAGQLVAAVGHAATVAAPGRDRARAAAAGFVLHRQRADRRLVLRGRHADGLAGLDGVGVADVVGEREFAHRGAECGGHVLQRLPRLHRIADRAGQC